jgi:hypothetical protein
MDEHRRKQAEKKNSKKVESKEESKEESKQEDPIQPQKVNSQRALLNNSFQ